MNALCQEHNFSEVSSRDFISNERHATTTLCLLRIICFIRAALLLQWFFFWSHVCAEVKRGFKQKKVMAQEIFNNLFIIVIWCLISVLIHRRMMLYFEEIRLYGMTSLRADNKRYILNWAGKMFRVTMYERDDCCKKETGKPDIIFRQKVSQQHTHQNMICGIIVVVSFL